MAAEVVSGRAMMTPDGRYIVVRGRLWRATNPGLPSHEREKHVQALMDARREVKRALAESDDVKEAQARAKVDAAKVALGERGPVWWSDGAPDLTRKMVRNTSYAAWFSAQSA